MSFMGDGMQTTVNIGGNSMGLQAAVDEGVASLNALGVRLDEFAAQGESTGFAMMGLGSAFAQSGDNLANMTETVGAGNGLMTQFGGVIDDVTGGMMRMAEQAVSFISAIAGWAIIQQVISWVQQLSDELFNLQVTTQKLDVGWQYLLGGGPQNGGIAASQNMMNWTSQFSLGIPFTRQDLMSAVTTLATAQMNTQQIEQFMPYLSDLAATYGSAAYGGQGVNLQQAANAIRMAQAGLSRMLKYDLNITPEELIPYGLQATGTGVALHITDPNSLIRALENFAQAKGVAGASGNIVGETWWGGWSSLTDQMQNFLLQAGGTNLNGTVNPGSFFGTIQAALDNLLKWFTDHHDEITVFANTISHLVGSVTSGAGGMLEQFVGYLNRMGAVQWLQTGLTTLDDVVSNLFGTEPTGKEDKKHPMGHRQQLAAEYSQNTAAPWLTQLTDALKTVAGIDLSGLGAFVQGLVQAGPSIAQTFDKIADDSQKIAASITPGEAAALDQMFQMLGSGTAQAAAFFVGQTVLQFEMLGVILAKVAPLAVQVGNFFSDVGAFFHDEQAYLGRVVDRFGAFLSQLDGLWKVLSDGLKLADPFNLLAMAIERLNQALKILTGTQLPGWLKNLPSNFPTFGLPFGGSGSSGSSQPNTTNMPGGYRTFGAIGNIG